MSLKPIAFACTRPRSTSRSFTHFSRRRSVARAIAGVPAGPTFDRASRRSLRRTSGLRDSSSTGLRSPASTAASWRQLRPGSSGISSRTSPRISPPTYPLEPFRGRAPRARADGEVDAANLRDRPEGLLDDRLAEKAGRAGDQDGLALQGFGNQDE